jgi:hypothetical protein
MRACCEPWRPPHTRLASRDDRANAPLLEAGRDDETSISGKEKWEYFSRNVWTEVICLSALTNFVFPRRRFSLPVGQSTTGPIVQRATDLPDERVPRAVSSLRM